MSCIVSIGGDPAFPSISSKKRGRGGSTHLSPPALWPPVRPSSVRDELVSAECPAAKLQETRTHQPRRKLRYDPILDVRFIKGMRQGGPFIALLLYGIYISTRPGEIPNRGPLGLGFTSEMDASPSSRAHTCVHGTMGSGSEADEERPASSFAWAASGGGIGPRQLTGLGK